MKGHAARCALKRVTFNRTTLIGMVRGRVGGPWNLPDTVTVLVTADGTVVPITKDCQIIVSQKAYDKRWVAR